MSDLVAIAYKDPHKAEEVRQKLHKLQIEHLVDLEDAVVAVKGKDSKIRLHQPVEHLPLLGAFTGSFWGLVVGLLFIHPLIGAAVGAAAGAATCALTDIGIDDKFMKNLTDELEPNSSVLFVLVRKASTEDFLKEFEGTGGTILQTTLSHSDEEKLKEAIKNIEQESKSSK